MDLKPPSRKLHLPYEAGPHRMTMGLGSVAEPDWIEIASDYQSQMNERQRLLRDMPDLVVACLPEGAPAARELLNMLVDHVCLHHRGWFRRDGGSIFNFLLDEHQTLDGDPLSIAGHLVQEDFCLMQHQGDAHVLVAAVLCFPARWSLAQKLGRNLLAIHDPVPGYDRQLGTPVERFFSALKPGRIVRRLNWSVMDDPTLFQTSRRLRTVIDPAITPDNALSELVLRVERQTFRLLPGSGAVVFGIRTHVTPLAQVVALPGEAGRLEQAVRALPHDLAGYKAIYHFADALLAALGRISREQPPEPAH